MVPHLQSYAYSANKKWHEMDGLPVILKGRPFIEDLSRYVLSQESSLSA